MNYRNKKREKLFFDRLTPAVWNNGLFVAFALLMILQRGFGGFGYRACIDDWFLYLSPSLKSNMWTDYILPNNKLAVRPFAGLLDSYVITPLANNLGIINIVLSAMLFAAVVMLYIYFRGNKIDAGGIFLIAAAMSPVFMEAIYWLSCASRIIPALFFTALSGVMLNKFFEKNRFGYFLVFAVTGFLSVGFYETIIPIYCIVAFIPIFRNFKSASAKFVFFIPIMHIVMIGCYYIFNSAASTEITGRGEILTFAEMLTGKGEIAAEIGSFITKTAPAIFTSSLLNGFSKLAGTGIFYMAAIAAVSILFGVFAGSRHGKSQNAVISLIVGLILTAAGIILCFMLDNMRITIRMLYAAVPGAALVINSLLSLILWEKPGKIIYGVICAALAFIFTVAGIGEIAEYRDTGQRDVAIAAELLKNEDFGAELEKPETHLWLFGSPVYYSDDEDVQYYEHIKASAENSAALTGSLIYYTGLDDMNAIVTAPDGEETSLYTQSAEEKFYYAGVEDDYTVSTLTMTAVGKDYELYRKDGTLYGVLTHMTKNIYRFDKYNAE